jgi:hypothetical protein
LAEMDAANRRAASGLESHRQGYQTLNRVIRRTSFNLALAAILGLFLIGCLFARPIADDFIYASNARAGFWDAWLREYLGWNGRYMSNAFVLSVPLDSGSVEYRAAACVMLVSTAAALFVFVRALAAGALTRAEALTSSLVFLTLYLAQVPSLGESIYWYTSAATYHVPLVLGLLHLTLVKRYVDRERPGIGSRLGLALAGVLLVVIVGSNEVIMLMMLAFYAAWLALSLRAPRAVISVPGGVPRDLPGRMLPGGLFAVGFVSALIMAFSPGNAVRQSMFPQVHHQLIRSLGMTALQMLRFSSDWVSSSALLLATVLFLPIAAKLSQQWSWDPSRARQYLWLLVIGLVLVIPAAVFPAYWETGVLGQHRTMNVAYFVFLGLWFLAIAAWFATNRKPAGPLRAVGDQFRIPIAVLLIAVLALTRNSYALGLDLVSGRLTSFAREIDGRQATLEACARQGRQMCEIPAIQNKPVSFYIVDVSTDPHDWVNMSYARYFGLGEVHLQESYRR